MGDIEGMAPPLHPVLREGLLLYRIGGCQLRGFESYNNRRRRLIGLLQSWLNNNPSDHPNRDAHEHALAVTQQDLNLYSVVEENMRQVQQMQRNILRNLIINFYSYLVQNPPTSIVCETIEDIEAVHTLSCIGIWPENQLFKVAIEWTAFNPVPAQYLAIHAMTLNLEVVPFASNFDLGAIPFTINF